MSKQLIFVISVMWAGMVNSGTEIVIQKNSPKQKVEIQETAETLRIKLEPGGVASIGVYEDGQEIQKLSVSSGSNSATAISIGSGNHVRVESGQVKIETSNQDDAADESIFGDDPFFK